MSFLMNPFTVEQGFVLDYNGFDGTTNPPTSGNVPEFYWFLLARWSPWNGGNDVDIDADGDSLQNGLDTDQDGDGMPDWWIRTKEMMANWTSTISRWRYFHQQ